uniref:Vacuolar protein sorting-associated protein 4B-like n=1 Tax=Phallusia mammillata TaxID=59560 RepID=A0A6F9DW17_9ASCI|nr:vacuolar protein sorting-associated protein 4B-like [Phallusia mammillata]
MLQSCLDNTLSQISLLHSKDQDDERKASLLEVFQLINNLNKKINNRNKATEAPIENRDCSTSSFSQSRSTRNESRKSAIEQTIVVGHSGKFDDVVGLNEAKISLNEAIVMPLLYPHLFTGNRRPWNRILMYGPPGTGKSRLAHALANEIQSTFYSVSSADLMSSLFGESEKMVRELFHHARSSSGRCVIFIDEIDSLCRRRSETEDESVRRIKTELLHQMDGGVSEDEIFLLCATNCPWELDPAFLRRFQKRVHISLPDADSRIKILKLHVGDDTTFSDEDWNELGDLTDGYSGSDLANLVNSALFEPVRFLQKAQHWVRCGDGKFRPCLPDHPGNFKSELGSLLPSSVTTRPLSMRDMRKCLLTSKATVGRNDLRLFDKFTAKFGQEGN